MKKTTRHHTILDLMQSVPPDQFISTKDLAEQFNVSETTIRRDFQELADAGLVQRQYGGALSPKPATNEPYNGQVGILLGSRIDKYRDPFYNLVLEGADRRLGELGYHVAYIKTFFEVQTPDQARNLLKNFKVTGLILLGSSTAESISYLRHNCSPIVTVTETHEVDDDVVMFDGLNGMRCIVDHLTNLGHRRLGYIAGYVDSRYIGFCQAIRALELDDESSLHQIVTPGPDGWTPQLGERGAKNLMELDAPPDAIVCASDRLAIGAMQWLQNHGYHVPNDIAVTGFDNIPDTEFIFPPLTTVHVHKELLGELAAERVVKRLENQNEVYLQITTPTSLVIRQSCGSN